MNIEEYQKMINNQSSFGTQSQFSNLAFPLIKKIIPQLLGGDEKKMKEIEAETKSINRENKIKSIEEDVEFKETKIQDHPDYESACGGLVSVQPMSAPSAPIFHLDFDYGSSSRIDDFFTSP